MGAMLEPTPAMGPWHVEVRRESAYLHGENPNWTPDDGPEPDHALRVAGTSAGIGLNGFAIPVNDLHMVTAAIHQILNSTPYRRWQEIYVQDAQPWDAKLVDGWLRITGPVIVYGTGPDWRIGGSVELPYEHLVELVGALAEARTGQL